MGHLKCLTADDASMHPAHKRCTLLQQASNTSSPLIPSSGCAHTHPHTTPHPGTRPAHHTPGYPAGPGSNTERGVARVRPNPHTMLQSANRLPLPSPSPNTTVRPAAATHLNPTQSSIKLLVTLVTEATRRSSPGHTASEGLHVINSHHQGTPTPSAAELTTQASPIN